MFCSVKESMGQENKPAAAVWKFEETDTQISDSAGNGNDGKIINYLGASTRGIVTEHQTQTPVVLRVAFDTSPALQRNVE